MKRCRLMMSRFVFVITLFLFLLLLVSPALAAWNQIMSENFESHTSLQWGSGPWFQGIPNYSHQWLVAPGPPGPTQQTVPHWGIQNKNYRVDPGQPSYIQAAWNDASTDGNGGGRDPEFASYRPSAHTTMIWGPIDCRYVHNMRMLADWVNYTLPGDTFSIEASANVPSAASTISSGYRSRDFVGVYQAGDSLRHLWFSGDASETWHTSTIRIDSLDSVGTVVSLVGRSAVWIIFRFRTTNTNSEANHMDKKGAFVDNVKVAIDDGLFNLNARNATHVRESDSLPIPYPQVLDTLLFKFQYSVTGSGIMRDSSGNPMSAHIVCTVNNAPFWDTSIVVDAGMESANQTIFAPHFIPRIENRYYARWIIDPDSLLRESSHQDNMVVDSFDVARPNSPPTISFIPFASFNGYQNLTDADTVAYGRPPNSHWLYPVIVNVYDEDDIASWYLAISQDTTAGSGAAATVTPDFPWYTHPDPSTNDTVWVDVGPLSDGCWYFSIVASDVINGAIVAKPRAALRLYASSVRETTSDLPTKSGLYSTYPNPFNAEVTFKVGLAETGRGELHIFDVMGREVDRLAVPGTRPGWYSVRWKPNQLSSGVYFTRFIAGGKAVSTSKVMYLK